jgi:Na+-translocating ferredoxin:NAD+ oxidoreductase RnfG subunit
MITRRTVLFTLPFVMTAPKAVFATSYFTLEQVQKNLFPQATRFVPQAVQLSPAQMSRIAKASGTRVRSAKVPMWQAETATGKIGSVMVDQVYGKHEFITYAVGIDASGAVVGVEIMDYRETYGDQIKLPKWRAQFTGKKNGDALEIDKPIQNIAGATLSCVHVTDGVRRLLATHAILTSAA